MKLTKVMAFLLLATIPFLSCTKEDDETEENLPYDFKTQLVQGKMLGVDWFCAVGTYQLTTSNSLISTVRMRFYPSSKVDSLCVESSLPTWDYAEFTTDYTEGVKLLEPSTNPLTGMTVNLYTIGSTVPVQCGVGAVEIVNIDDEQGVLSVKIDATYSPLNFLNGMANLTYCP